jgi:hypothetical protein
MPRKFIAALLICLLALIPPAHAQPMATPFRIDSTAGGVRISWSLPASARNAAGQPGDVVMPDQLVAARVDNQLALVPLISQLESVPWNGHLTAVAPIGQQTLDGQMRPELAITTAPALPNAPVRVLRDGVINGVRLVVLAIAPHYDAGNRPRALLSVIADLPGATKFDGQTADLLTQQAAVPSAVSPPPTNPVIGTALARIRVDHEGLQHISGATLATAGVDLAGLVPTYLRLFHRGQEVALELIGSSDGQIDPADELHFFATAPGDRWNASDTYWLATGTIAGLRIGARSAQPATALLSTTAIEQGSWREGHIYDTTIAGPVGDYWYAADLKTDPSGVAETIFTATLTPTLALGAGQLTLTIDGAAYTAAARTLVVRGNGASQSQTWSGTGAWTKSFTLAANPATIELALQRGAAPAGIEIQQIRFSRMVQLNLAGRGALFTGLPTAASYQVLGSATGRTFYDITDPQIPVQVTIPNGTDFSFADDANRRYLLSGPGLEYEPLVTHATLTDLASPLNIQALSIAPLLFHASLAPLLDRRRAQGYSAAVVDVQAIYDAWSDGQTDPRAIRNFLRYARNTWATPPIAVTLVGDGTADPLNYVRRNNTNFIPPFLAHVDPYIGETACENCYAQLDGDDPLSDPLPDVPLGRLPVKSVSELQSLITKIIAYETGPIAPDWQSRELFVADNYREADGQIDSAGDFALQSDVLAAHLPQGVEARKLYYDPSPNRPNEPWREPDALRANQQTLKLFGEGAAIVTYIGHSSQFQWAVTDLSVQPSSLLGLYDSDALTNLGRPAIVRELTCLTAAFHTPAFSGTTIDERLLLAPGGAVAIWGSTGKGVLHGHDLLAQGFDNALWHANTPQPTIGQLALAGYVELYTKGNCCQDSIWTYIVLGDPLTGVRVIPGYRTFLPMVVR